MRFMTGILEESLGDAAFREPFDTRTADLKRNYSGTRRRAALALHGMARHATPAAIALLNRDLHGTGYEYLGSGHEATAYLERGQGRVLKMHRRTAHLTPAEQQENIAWRHQQHETLRAYLGDIVAHQSLALTAHPFIEVRGKVIQSRMNYYVKQFGRAIFEPHQPHIDELALIHLLQYYPAAREALGFYSQAAHMMYEDTGQLPDTNGADNLLWATETVLAPRRRSLTPGLFLVDTVGLWHNNNGIQDNVLGQLGELSEALKPSPAVFY